MRRIATYAMGVGVVPVLSTIPPRQDRTVLANRVGSFNAVIAAVARRANLPLWNYWRALQASGMVNHGISHDGIHPNVYQGDKAADLTTSGLRYGYNQRNLTALQVLSAMRPALTR